MVGYAFCERCGLPMSPWAEQLVCDGCRIPTQSTRVRIQKER
jgi:hypothetical protein